jgi:hypothetical protein
MGKPAQKLCRCWQLPSVMIVGARHLFTSGLSHLTRVENLWNMIRVQADLQRPQWTNGCSSAWKSPQWSPFNHPRDCWGSEHLLWFVPSSFNIAANFVPRLLSDDQKSRRLEVCEELKTNGRNGATVHWVASSQVMKHRFTGITREQSSSFHSGGHLIHPVPQEKQDKLD